MSNYLFDMETEPTVITDIDLVDKNELSKIAALYTCGFSGRNSGIRFFMSIEDAQTWCSWDGSKGSLRGHPWIYCYTSVLQFVFAQYDFSGVGYVPPKPELDLRKNEDDGSWDFRISQLGLRKIHLDDIADIIQPMGLQVLR